MLSKKKTESVSTNHLKVALVELLVAMWACVVSTSRSASELNNTCFFQGKSIAILVPHSDDEIIGCFHFIDKFGGKNCIDLIYVTDARDPRLAEIRKNESFKATKILPINKRVWWHLQDGSLQESSDRIKRLLSQVNDDYDIVLSPAINDKTSDHAIVGKEAFDVIEISKLLWYRSTWLTFPLRASDIIIEGNSSKKRQALRCFKSQSNMALMNVVHFSKVEAKLSGISAESVEAFRFASSGHRHYEPLNTLSLKYLWHIRGWS